MKILLLDIDSLRADRLGCYGYHRNTSPTIDRLAEQGARLEHCYASDVPCCPSRSSLFSGRYGIHHGCVTHEGSRATPYTDPGRGFVDARDRQTLPALLRQNGHRCAFISSFPTRHSAWHSLAGFDDWIDTGEKGHELAPTVFTEADDWLSRHGQEDNWFCHVTFWDVHTPYRTPDSYGDPFADKPPPEWPDAEALQMHLRQGGMRSAMDSGWSKGSGPRQPHPIDSPDKLTAFQNGYDTAVRYVDDHIQRLLDRLESMGIADEVAIIVTADHGEDMGEFNAYGSHCFCGPSVARVPLIIRWPGQPSAVLDGLHQHFDLSATILDILGIESPVNWDARSFLPAWEGNPGMGRDVVVSSNLAQGLQRAIYWQREPGTSPFCYLKTNDNWGHPLPEEAVIVPEKPHHFSEDHILEGRQKLSNWLDSNLKESPDPIEQVQVEGKEKRELEKARYRERLIATNREHI